MVFVGLGNGKLFDPLALQAIILHSTGGSSSSFDHSS